MSQIELDELEDHEDPNYQPTEAEILTEIDDIEDSLGYAAPPMQKVHRARLKEAYAKLEEIRQQKEPKVSNQDNLSPQEKQILIECINQTIKATPNSIQAALTLIPIVQKLQAKDEQTEA